MIETEEIEMTTLTTFVVEYTSYESNFRWTTVEAENDYEARILALEDSDWCGDGICEILVIYEGDSMCRDEWMR